LKSFRVQIIVVTMSALISFAVVLFLALYSHNLDTTQKRMDDAVEGAFAQISSTFGQTLESVASCHSFILNHSDMMSLLRGRTDHMLQDDMFRLNVQSEILKVVRMFTWLDYVYLFDDDGNVLGVSRKHAYTRVQDPEFPFFSSRMYEQIPQEPTFYFLSHSPDDLTYHDAISGTQTLYSVRQMVYGGRKYYILLGLRESIIRRNYESLSGMLGGELLLIDRSGAIASAADKSLLNTMVEDWSEEWMRPYERWTVEQKDEQLFFMKLPTSNLYAMIRIPMERYTADAVATLRYIITALIVCAAVSTAIMLFRLSRLMRQINTLMGAMDEIGSGKLGLQIDGMSSYEFQLMALRFNDMSRRIERLLREKQVLERKRYRLEMETLRNQINPHFLYNSLNMVQWMAQLNEMPGIERAVKLLGGMVRPLYKEGPLCTLEEELQYCGMFVELCSLRYGKRITLNVDREGVPEGLIVLRLMLQPVIENSVVHGLAEVKRGCEVNIRVRTEDEDMVIEVMDNGRGFEEDSMKRLQEALDKKVDAKSVGLSGGGFVGLSNVARRIVLEYGEPYGIGLSNCESGGGCVKITIPISG